MRQVTGSMANVVKGMDSAMKAMDLEKVMMPPSLLSNCTSFESTNLSRPYGVEDIKHKPLDQNTC